MNFSMISLSSDNVDPNTRSLLVAESVKAVLATLVEIEITQPDNLKAFDDLAALSKAQGKNLFDVAILEEIPMTTRLIAMIVQMQIYHWAKGKGGTFQIASIVETMWPETISREAGYEARILNHSLYTLEGLAHLQDTGEYSHEEMLKVTKNLYDLSQLMFEHDKIEIALACAASGVNISFGLKSSEREIIAASALKIAHQSKEKDVAALRAFQYAEILIRIADEDPFRQVDAFDAFELSARLLPDNFEFRKQITHRLRQWMTERPYLLVHSLTLWLSLPKKERWDLPDEVDLTGLSAAIQPFWNGTWQAWLEHHEYISAWTQQVENQRLALQKVLEDHTAVTNWSTWTIDHPALRRAIPHSTSILRETNLDDLLLVLSHEITHIYSMAGIIGIASIALRWVIAEMELKLWTFEPYGMRDSIDPDELLQKKGLAELYEPDVLALAEVEQQVEVARKVQIYEDAWAPWFEGLGVFGEIAADPETDPEAYSPITAVIYHLWEKNLAKLAEQQGISIADVIMQERAFADKRYSEAINKNGAYRLRSYLSRYGKKYLAGYLAVRSIVAAWRKTLGRPVLGSEAIRLLLHITRFGSQEALPNFSTPLENFEYSIVEQQLKWLETIAAISKSDLERALSDYTRKSAENTMLRWEHGRLMEVSREELDADPIAELVAKVGKEALMTLRGELASLSRVQNEDENLQALMQATADALTNANINPRLLNQDNVVRVLTRQMILPIGQAECRFWLLPSFRMVACWVRTTEQDYKHGRPGYDGIIFPLEEDKYLDLEKRFQQSKRPYMVVTRVADLVQATYDENGKFLRGDGTNLIAFQYDDWMFVQKRGQLFGNTDIPSSLLENIKDRLISNPAINTFQWLAGEEFPSIVRSKNWLEMHQDWNVSVANLSADLTPWVNHVLEFTRAVLNHDENKAQTSFNLNMYHFVLGHTDSTMSLLESGLASLAEHDSSLLMNFIRILDISARKPEINDEFAALWPTIEELLGPIIELTEYGWDVIPPQSYKKMEK